MPDPASQTAAAVAISGLGAGTVSAIFGIETGALFWAFLGAICSRTIQPSIQGKAAIAQASGFAVISTVLGSVGASWAVPITKHFAPFLATVDYRMLVALPAFLLGLLGHEVLLRSINFIREFKKGGP
jgi:hypothetical protein